MLKLKTPDAGGPYTVTVSDGEAVTLENVLIGEVWICSGQSNMEMPVGGWGRVRDYAREIESADWPRIRLFGVKRVSSLAPREDVQVVGGGWQPCSPQTVPDFSAAGYFFARELHKALGVPVGVINTSWGGTVAESWMSPEALATHSDFAERVEQVRSAGADESRLWAGFRDDSARWEQVVAQRDPAYRDGKCLWKERSFDDSDWDTIALPAYFDAECLPDHDGIVWLRRRIEIPARWRGRDLILRLSYVDDRDVTYFNGVQVGATHALEQERVYRVPGRLVEGGEAVIAIRVLDTGGDGGLNYDGPSLRLSLSDDRYIPLSGPWRYRVGSELADLPAPPVQPDFDPHRPTALYHSMLRPLVPLAFRGAVWYQGESNAWRAEQYGTLFPLLVEDWRSCWGRDFPFLFVQLANFGARHDEPAASQWAELREAQSEALHLDGTAMAVAIDIGEDDNIHPKNKQELGRRLALIARARVYGESVACSGPVYRTYRIEGDKIRIRFDEAEGLAVRDGPCPPRVRCRRGRSPVPLGRGCDRRMRRGGRLARGPVSFGRSLRLGRQSGLQSDQCFRTAGLAVPDRPLAGNHDREEIIRILSANEHRVSSCRRSRSHVLPGTVFADDGQLVRAGIWAIPSRPVVGFGQNSYF